MTKVVFLNRYYYPDQSATSQLLTDLTFHLARSGFKILVISGRTSYNNRNVRYSAEETIVNVDIKRVWTTNFGRGLLFGRVVDYVSYYVSVTACLAKNVNKGDVVVAETDPPLLSVVAWIVVSIKRAKLVNWLQDVFPEIADVLAVKGFGGVLSRSIRKIRDVSLRAAESNVVLGERMKNVLLSSGVRDSAIEVVHNWSVVSDLKPIPKTRNSLRKKWVLDGKFVVGYSGNMGRVHDFSTILDAADLLKAQEDVIFLFIGDGPQKEWLCQEANSRQLNNVVFKPYQDRSQLGMSLSLPDIHLITLKTDLEGLSVPSKFYGAAAMARPVIFIGDRNGEIANIVKRSGGGSVVAQSDARKLAKDILHYKNDAGARRKAGSNIRKCVTSNYTKRKSLEQWTSLLRKVVKEESVDGAIFTLKKLR